MVFFLHAKMKSFFHDCQLSDPKAKSCLYSLIVIATLICGVYFTGSALLAKDFRVLPSLERNINDTHKDTLSNKCEGKCRPQGSEALPEGIRVETSNLEMRPLWGPITENQPKRPESLLALAVGIKQKELVNQIVEKFLENEFVVMLFHYDNVVDEWNDLQWSSRVIHLSALNQTKWWFAKRFLHPDIVAEYDYIFLWDEDLGIENFHPGRYVTIVKEEGLEISQPALDPAKSEVHHQISARKRGSKVHRRYYKSKGGGRCYDNSTSPPCTGWVEMMAPVFSRAAWRCAWYMIQNDLIHAWGLDMLLGYCAQGDRARKVGVVDEEYIVHMGLPTLGGLSGERKLVNDTADHSSPTKKNSSDSETLATPPILYKFDNRSEVRKRSYDEMLLFWKRWKSAVEEDQCWIDPYQETAGHEISEHI